MLTFPGCNLAISDHPVRRVISRGSVRMNGRFASFKMGKTISWESQNEEAFLLRAELSPEVSAIYAQPIKLSLVTDAGERFHFPDFAVVIDNKLEIHEVKSDEKAAKREIRDLLELAARHVAANGAIYSVALASVLKADPVYTNLKAFVRRLHDSVTESLRLAVRDELHKRGPLSLVELAERTAYWGGTVGRVCKGQSHRRMAAICTIAR